jgi:hypothetical protein
MTTPPPDQPTRVIPQVTAEQPQVSTAPATRRARLWEHRLPARIGRARTSTVVIGCLWVLFFALHGVVAPDPVEYTTVTDANTGAEIRVPASLVPSAPSTTAPATTPPAESPTSDVLPPAGTSTPPEPRSTTAAPRSTTPAPSTTAPRSTSTPPEEDEPAPTTQAPTTSREPAPSALETDVPEESSAPTS